MTKSTKINEAVDYIKRNIHFKPTIGLVLGSGLGDMIEELEEKVVIPYEDIPHFPISTVEGHAGNLIFGKLMGKVIVAMQGRFHYYEGYSMQEVTFPIRVMAKLGISEIIVTNAAGGINKKFEVGDLMVIDDIINMQGTNPLIGKNLEEFGVRFPDMSTTADKGLKDVLIKVSKELEIPLKEGVYVAMTGPNYETPAEVNMLRILGADAVGMSTAPEIIVARHSGIKVLGISCITNMAAGILSQPLSHHEVIDTTNQVKENFKKLLKKAIDNI